MADTDFVAFTNQGLPTVATRGQTSTVGEPSVGAIDNEILFTGNWYAARSLDGGNSWSFVSPRNTFPSANGGFCCDQLAISDPTRNVTFWLLQYLEDSVENTIRIAVKGGGTLGDDEFHWYDFVPSTVNPAWDGEWFDYEGFALSDNFLYVTANLFALAGGSWRRAVVLRLPIDAMAAGGGFTFDFHTTTDNGSLRCVQGATNTMYFADAMEPNTLRLFSWPENSSVVSSTDLTVSLWSGGNGYNAPGPDNNNWLSRCDSRITAGWLGDGILGFMWTADRGPGRPMPFVRVVRIDPLSATVIDEPDIWNDRFAFAYPSAAPNSRGHIGVAMLIGGGSRFPGMVVGVWDDVSNGWELHLARAGTNGPIDGKSGDYTTVRPRWPGGFTWVAAGFTLQGGSTFADVEPRFVHFGRERDAP